MAGEANPDKRPDEAEQPQDAAPVVVGDHAVSARRAEATEGQDLQVEAHGQRIDAERELGGPESGVQAPRDDETPPELKDEVSPEPAPSPESEETIDASATGRLAIRATKLIDKPPANFDENAPSRDFYLLSTRRPEPETYAAKVSDAAVAEGPSRFAENDEPIKSDDGRFEVASAEVLTKRLDDLAAKGTPHKKIIAEVGSPHGLRTFGLLKALDDKALREKRPSLTDDPEFRADIFTDNEATKEAIQKSGLFDDYGDKVHIITRKIGDPEADVEQGTIFAIFNGAPHYTPHRVARDEDTPAGEGKPFEVQTVTVTADKEPFAVADQSAMGTISPKIIDVGLFANMDTVDTNGARQDYAAKTRVKEWMRVPDDEHPDRLSGLLEERDDDLDEFMVGTNDDPGNLQHFAPDLEDDMALVIRKLDPNAHMVAEARVRHDFRSVRHENLTLHHGRVADHLVERRTFVRSLVSSGHDNGSVYVPVLPGNFTEKTNYALLDLSEAQEGCADYEMAMASKRIWKSEIDGPESTTGELISQARLVLESDGDPAAIRDELEEEPKSAQQLVIDMFNAHVRQNPQARYDSDLAKSLGNLFNEYGKYAAAVALADHAVKIAPHVDAEARVIRARALIGIGNAQAGSNPENARRAFKLARQNADEAVGMSPRYADGYRIQAEAAHLQGDMDGYAAAVAQAFNYTRQDNPQDVVKIWKDIVEAKVKASTTERHIGKLVMAREVWPQKPDPETGIWRPRVEPLSDDEANGVRRFVAADTARLAAAGMNQFYEAVMPDRMQKRLKAASEIMQLGSQAIDAETFAAVRASIMSGGLLVGEAAEKLIDYDAKRFAELATVEEAYHVETVEPLSEHFDGVALGIIPGHDGKPDRIFAMTPETSNTFTLIIGVPMAGKTTVVKNEVIEMAKAGLPVCIVDCGDRAQFMDLPDLLANNVKFGNNKIMVLDPGNPDAVSFSLGMLNPIKGYDAQKHIDMVRMLIEQRLEPHEPFPQVLAVALQNLFADHGYNVKRGDGTRNPNISDTPEFITLEALYHAALDAVDEIGYDQKLAKDVRGFIEIRFRSLMQGTLGQILGGDRPLDFNAVANSNMLFTLHNVEHAGDRRMIGALFIAKWRQYLTVQHQARGNVDSGILHWMHLSEAHHLMGSNPMSTTDAANAEYWKDFSTGVRGLGGGLSMDSQNARRLDPDLIAVASTRMVLRAPDYNERLALLPSMGVNPGDPLFDEPLKSAAGRGIVFRNGVDTKAQEVIFKPPPEVDSNNHAEPMEPVLTNSFGMPHLPYERWMTEAEVDRNEIALTKEEHAPLVSSVFLVTMARLSNNKYPDAYDEVKKWWNEAGSEAERRERSQLLKYAVVNTVLKRAKAILPYYSPGKLINAVLNDMEQILDGVPLAGTNPGADFVLPELVGALAHQALHKPVVTETQPSEKSLVTDDTGALAAAGITDGAEYGLMRAGEVRERLNRKANTTIGGDKANSRITQERVWAAVLGDDDGDSITTAHKIMTGYQPDATKIWLEISERASIRQPGQTSVPWPYAALALPRRVVAKSSPKPAEPGSAVAVAREKAKELVTTGAPSGGDSANATNTQPSE